MKTDQYAQLNWYCQRDLPGVVAINDASFVNPWTEGQFKECLAKGHNNMLVAHACRELVGYALFHQHRDAGIQLWTLAVHPAARRLGIGRQLIGALQNRLRPGHKLLLEVRETDLAAQLFLKALDIIAVRVLRAHFSDTGEDAYRFRYVAPGVRAASEAACRGR